MDQTTNSVKMTKDRIIKELIDLLNQNQQKEAANNVFEMAAYIDGMEQKMDAVLEELVNVRKQFAELRGVQERKTVWETLSGMADKLEQQYLKLKHQILEVKTEVRAKAAEIVVETKQRGKAALNRVSEFLGIREKLQNIRQNLQASIADVDKSIGKIDALGMGMREAGHTIANTFRTFADKPEKEYEEKKFSKTELLKKPFQVKRKLLFSILDYADAAIEKTERFSTDIRKQRLDKVERKKGSIGDMEAVNPDAVARVAEPEFRYGAEVFEAHQKEAVKVMTKDNVIKNVPVKSGKSR